MAAPNIVNTVSIAGQTAVQIVTTTATAIVSNPTSSANVYKLNSLIVSNVDGANTANITADLYRSSTAYRIVYKVTVSPLATLVVVGKDAPMYLMEGDSIRLTAGANNTLEAISSYEVIG